MFNLPRSNFWKQTGGDCAPIIGDNCIISSGAKIIGGITLGDNVVVGANAVVTKSFPSNTVIAGVPAKIISYNSNEIIRHYIKQ